MARKKLEKEDTKVVEVSVVEATEEVMEKKETKKRPTKKSAEVADETVEKKTAKRATTKKVKTTFVVQANGKEVSMEDAVTKVKEAWIAEGNKETEIKEIAVYVKPEEAAIYYVINGVATGKVDF